MFDPKALLDDLLGSRIPGTESTVREKGGQALQLAKDNPLATGALAAVLLGTGAGRQLTGTALKLGGIAAVGALAYKAYQNYRSGSEPGADAGAGDAGRREPELLPPPADTDFHHEQAPQGGDEFALSLIRAMIAAARADGHIDDEERSRIADRLKVSGIGAEAERFMMEELERPVDMDALVGSAKTEAQRVELYTASRLAIDPETRAERGYLDLLAGRLDLPDALVDHVEQTVVAAKAPAAPSAVPAGTGSGLL